MSAHIRHISRHSSPAARDDAIDRHLVERRSEFLGYFRRRLASPEEAEDVVQDFSLKVIRATPPPEGENVHAWLGRMLNNTLTDHRRRRATRWRAETRYALEPRDVAVEPEPEAKPCLCVHEVLTAIRTDYAEIIRRVDLEEVPRDRIASELGLTANNVGVRLHRARRALKVKLKERCVACCHGGFQDCGCAGVSADADEVQRHDP